MSRKPSISRAYAQTQSTSAAPQMEFVTVAVLPPRLPPGVAPPTGIGASEAMAWDEKVNWSHNEKIDKPGETSRRKSFLQKTGLVSRTPKANPDTPPFIFRKVPYETWRNHYAKDKDGRYRGKLAPAEDCLLLPEDVEKWRLGDPETKADLWTRGKAALPVYGEQQEDALPAYQDTYDGPPPEEPRLASVSSAGGSTSDQKSSGFTADGKTTEQIIKEAEEKIQADKNKPGGWKDKVKRGAEFAMMGTNL